MTSLVVVLLLPALCWVVVTDLLYRKIHNRLVLALLAGWLVLPLLAPLNIGPFAGFGVWQTLFAMGWSTAGAALVFLVGYGLYMIERVGGGDVKLMTVLSLWIGSEDLITFLIITSLAGGILALVLPTLEMLEAALARGVMWLIRRMPQDAIAVPIIYDAQRPAGIPYGLAIAAGALFTLLFPIHT
ncbi:A24 family peptidase [Pseudomonas capsici]|uniref:A24 family peptidase n=1 Tax=Pseudomonas capsici TaxID=2810614 RepID=UPI0021F1ACDE|nr:prepilin peptidase [Pseudomonas capsici]MCV4340820.1 prepilin peptidase [Pseudomonas capsici]